MQVRGDHGFGFYLKLVIKCALMSLYLHFINEFILVRLFNPRANIKQLVDEMHGDTTSSTLLEVMLYSILCDDSSLVREVWDPTQRRGVAGLEQEELQRSELCSKRVANVLLTKTDNRAEAPLEEDLFRVAVLGSAFGARRLERARIEWIDQNFLRANPKLKEPLSIPLVRGLCGLIGGFGEALRLCSLPSDKTHGAVVRIVEEAQSWALSPGALACVHFAAKAAAGWITTSLYKTSHLLILAPATLNAIFMLNQGVQEFSSSSYKRRTGADAPMGIRNPELLQLLQACDSAATEIIRSVSARGEVGRVTRVLGKACVEWTRDLQGQGVSSSGFLSTYT
jgi:hypothetical protein